MPYNLSIRPEAEADLCDAFNYYQHCRPGLGQDFLLCIEAAFERITRNPHQYQIVHKTVRRTVIQRLPYGIYYIVVANEHIIVLAVMALMRDPTRWQGRA